MPNKNGMKATVMPHCYVEAIQAFCSAADPYRLGGSLACKHILMSIKKRPKL